MKYFGSTVEFTHHRNAEIMRIYRQKIVEADFVCMEEIYRQVAESPASRFWVSEERAAIVISAMEAGRALPCMTKSKRDMFTEIFRRYKLLRPLYPDKPIKELAAIIVHQPAPKFYYTPRSVGQIISKIRRGFYFPKKERRKDGHCK